MPEGTRIAAVEDAFTNEREAILIRCDEAPVVRAWLNNCTHEAQRLDRGGGAAMRDGEIICPKHGSMFDACSGECDNGQAAGTTLPGLEVAVRDGDVFLTDKNYEPLRDGGIDDDEGPSSTSHLSL